MLKSLISLKPSSVFPKHKHPKPKKPLNFLSSAVDALFCLLDFIELEDIFKLYRVYHTWRKGEEVAHKVVLYLTLSLRKYQLNEEKHFLRSATHGFSIALKDYSSQNNTWKQPISLDIERTHLNPMSNTGFSELDFSKKPSMQSVKSQHQIPHQPQSKIQLIQPAKKPISSKQTLQSSKHTVQSSKHSLESSRHGIKSSRQQPKPSRQGLKSSRQDIKSSRQRLKSSRESSRQGLHSIKFNFLIFSCDEGLTSQRRRDSQRRSKDPQHMKSYLKTVLNGISNRNKQLGYVQGLNYWVKHMYETRFSQQQAFIYSCFILEQLQAQQLFKNELTRVQQMCYVFDVYLFNNLPAIYYLFKLYDVSSTVYAGNWFITLFSEQLSKRVINKIWHLMIVQGWKVLVQFGIAVLCVFQEQIKRTPEDQLFCFMRNILERIGAENEGKIWRVMASVNVSNNMIDYLSRQMHLLGQDSQIQLWRLEDQHQKQRFLHHTSRRYSLYGCRPSLSKIQLTMIEKRMPIATKYIEQDKQVDGCCSSYYFSRHSIKTETDTDDEHSILSACRSVHYQ